MFNIFPVTLSKDTNGKINKIPLVKWKTEHTPSSNTDQIKNWQTLYGDRINLWGTPTGSKAGTLVLDIDVKDGGLETAKTLDIPHTMSQRTMSGGVHHFFKYPQDGKVYGNRVGFMPGLDIRGEGGYVGLYGVDNTPMVKAPQWLLDHAIKQDIERYDNVSIGLAPDIAQAIMDDCLENIREAPEGESNNILNIEAYNVGQLVAAGSYTLEVAKDALLHAALERGKPLTEAKATILSGIEGGVKKPLTSPFGASEPILSIPLPEPEGRWTPRPFTKAELQDESKLRKPQLFKNWSTEDITITTADGGTGKTTLKLYEAICLALGAPFLGFECKQRGKTLFITGEDTKLKLGAMIGQVMKQMGILNDDEKVKIILSSVIVKKDSDLCLIAKDRQNFLQLNPEAMRRVSEAVEDIKPKMIIFDPISSFWGSESSLNDMNKAVIKFMSELVEKSEACVEMINHMGKQSSTNKDMSQFAGRGGTGLPSNARISRVLRPIFEDEYEELTGESLNEKQTAIMCNVNKFTDGSPLYNEPFLIIREGFLFVRKTLNKIKIREEKEKISDNERVFNFIKEERRIKRYPSKEIIVAHFMTCGDTISEARIKRSVNMLVYMGHMGEKIKPIENPDVEAGGKVYVTLDHQGVEV